MWDKSRSFEIFDRISDSYDSVNRILSGGIDIWWRAQVRKMMPRKSALRVVDFATGTADQLLTILKSGKVKEALGLDLSKEMLGVGRKKIARSKFRHIARLEERDAQQTGLCAECADLVTMSFGIRNVPDPELCLREMHRLLADEGRAVVLEFSLPSWKWFRSLYLFYLRHILPRIGRIISKDASAYTYLNQTIETFPHGQAFSDWMLEAGFSRVRRRPLTFGIATLYCGEK